MVPVDVRGRDGDGPRVFVGRPGYKYAAVVALVGGCYAHQPRTPIPAWRPDLPGPQAGVYEVVGPDGRRGTERFTVTATAGRWQLDSQRTSPAGDEGFRLAVDLATAEPVAFEVWRGFDDLRRTARGYRQDGWFVVEVRGVGAPFTQRVPYAAGTMIDAATPTFKAVALALLSTPLSKGEPVPVRTIRIDGPRLRARVVLSTLQQRGHRDGARLVRSIRPDEPAAGLWVRADGWPVRMRALDAEGRRAWSWRISTSTTADAGVRARE